MTGPALLVDPLIAVLAVILYALLDEIEVSHVYKLYRVLHAMEKNVELPDGTVIPEAEYCLNQAKQAAAALNLARDMDPAAILSLLSIRVPASVKMMSDHPSVQVRNQPNAVATDGGSVDITSVSVLGLINGIMTPMTGHVIQLVVGDPDPDYGIRRIEGFSVQDIAKVKNVVKDEGSEG